MSTNRKGLQAVATAAPKPKTAERTLKAGKIYQPTSMIFPEVGEKIFFFFFFQRPLLALIQTNLTQAYNLFVLPFPFEGGFEIPLTLPISEQRK